MCRRRRSSSVARTVRETGARAAAGAAMRTREPASAERDAERFCGREEGGGEVSVRVEEARGAARKTERVFPTFLRLLRITCAEMSREDGRDARGERATRGRQRDAGLADAFDGVARRERRGPRASRSAAAAPRPRRRLVVDADRHANQRP